MSAARLQADIAIIIVHAAFWTSLLFIPAVSACWPWWKHQFGRAVISVDVLLAAAFLPAELRLMFGIPAASPAFGWFTLAVLACIPLRTLWLAVAVYRMQRTGKEED